MQQLLENAPLIQAIMAILSALGVANIVGVVINAWLNRDQRDADANKSAAAASGAWTQHLTGDLDACMQALAERDAKIAKLENEQGQLQTEQAQLKEQLRVHENQLAVAIVERKQEMEALERRYQESERRYEELSQLYHGLLMRFNADR